MDEAADQMREVLIHKNYLSQKDIEICLGCDLSSLGTLARFAQLEELHRSLQHTYSDSETAAPKH